MKTCKTCGHGLIEAPDNWVAIPDSEYEVTVEVLHKDKTYAECEHLKPEGCDFLDLELIGKIVKHPKVMKTLKMDSSSTQDDFFFKQPFPQNGKCVAGFVAFSGRANLGCGRDPRYSDASLGVRWKRKVKK